MQKAVRSGRADAVDVAIAAAIGLLGLAALVVPDVVLHLMPDCLVSKVIDDTCIGCGMTHAVIALMHGRLTEAWQLNPLSLPVAPALSVIYARYLQMVWRSRAVFLQGAR